MTLCAGSGCYREENLSVTRRYNGSITVENPNKPSGVVGMDKLQKKHLKRNWNRVQNIESILNELLFFSLYIC